MIFQVIEKPFNDFKLNSSYRCYFKIKAISYSFILKVKVDIWL